MTKEEANGSLQDRLVSELRLAGVSTLEEANRFMGDFLSRYNARFALPPRETGVAYRKAEGIDLSAAFCLKHGRVVGLDNVVRFKGHRLQVLPSLNRLSYARCSVEVHESFSEGDASLKVYYQGHYLDTCPAPAEASQMRDLVKVATGSTGNTIDPVAKPAKAHPWRQWVYR